MSDKFLIITCDGGGLRGVMTSLLLQDLGHRVLSNTHMFAGTSTGSFIAASLASGRTIDQVLDFYECQSSCKVFYSRYKPTDSQKHIQKQLSESIEKAVANDPPEVKNLAGKLLGSLPSLLYPKHNSQNKEAVLKEQLKDILVSEVNKKLFLPSLQLNSPEGCWKPVAFQNLQKDDLSQVKIVDAVLSSEAMPPGFAPHEIDGQLFSDGSLIANNPAAFALNTLLSEEEYKEKLTNNQIYMLSVGTGTVKASYPPPGISKELYNNFPYGVLGWLNPKAGFPLIAAMSESGSDLPSIQAENILGNNNFKRANIIMEESIPTDDCSRVEDLKALAENYIRSPEWASIRSWAIKNFT